MGIFMDPGQREVKDLFSEAGQYDLYQDLVNYRYLIDEDIVDKLDALDNKLNSDLDAISNEATLQYDALAARAGSLDPDEYTRLSNEIYAKEMADRQALANASEIAQQELKDQRKFNKDFLFSPEFAQQVLADPSLVSSGAQLTKQLEDEFQARLAEREKDPDYIKFKAQQDEFAALQAEYNKVFDEMANLPPIPVAQAPELTQEYLLSKSLVPREEALAEADRILSKYVFADPAAEREYIANIAQLYGIANTENQLGGILQDSGFNLADAAVDPNNPAQQRYLSDLEATKGITAFQPTMPQFTFGQPPVQPSGLPQQASPGLPDLLVPAQAPVLSPGLATIGTTRAAPPPLLAPTEAPVLSPQTAYIGLGAPVSAPVAAPVGMKEGGLAAAARQVASAGRGGDTMLAHITPEEAGILKALGGSGTINPKTGLPEFLRFKLGRGGLDINIGKKSQQALAIGAGVGAGLGFIPSFIPGVGAVASTGILAGLAGALGNQNLNAGLNLGLSAYGAGSLTQALAPPSATVGAPPSAPTGTGSMSGSPAGVESGVVNVSPSGAESLPGQYSSVGLESIPATVQPATGAQFDQAIQDALYSPGGPGVPVDAVAYGDIPYESFGQTVTASTPAQIAAQERVLYNPLSDPEVGGIANLSAPFEVQAVSPGNAVATAPDGFLAGVVPKSAQQYVPDFLLDASGTTLAAGTLLGTSLLGGAQERQAFARQQAALRAQEEDKKRRYRELFESTLGAMPTRMARSGGLMSLAKGGMTYMEAGGTTGPTGAPRNVEGTGDGMSDSVPATIEGVQEARLADGEFVIPADVVADIGNGSSSAGSKKLYDMMDRIRKARHGTTEQPPEINAERMMPA